MNGPIRRVAIGVFICMSLLLAGVTWYQVVRADELRNDQRNPRPLLSERGKERGLIVTADGTVLARSIEDPEDPRSFVREYPEGAQFAHLVGYSSFLVGSSGLEGAYGPDLRSRRDLTISDLVAALLGRDLRPNSIEVTVDPDLQRAAYDALGSNRGAVVALDPATGAVLASVSSPSYDPSLLLGNDAAEQFDILRDDPTRPLLDRGTREIYPPGSTFKTVVAAAALDTGAADPGTTFDDPAEFQLPGSNATISNANGRPCNDGVTATLLEAFVRSCNTIFADLSIQLGAVDIGITADALGFNQEIAYEWEVPEAVWNTEQLAQDAAALGQSGIGERDVRATPLHMAMVAAAVANDGAAVSPYAVSRIFGPDGTTAEETQVAELGRAMSSETAMTLTQMMERVVTEGTGRGAAVPGVRVAGKTGTSTGADDFPNPWFIGFAPVDDPTIAIAVLIEGSEASGESASGGSVAAPIASRLFELWLSG
ncbi:MAG TPA: penicillin-binding transpeptidase domain-containing protein [Acidimicrobiia bacterium]|nr:penicillin-binding transpeptidase domain-containing protein [Acidimicrobiia bacterium]